MILDMIAHNNWERPIYFAITIPPSKFLNLQDYFQMEGFAYRLVPIKSGNLAPDRINFGRAATDIMYDNLFNEFKWGNMNDPRVYIDENNSRMMTNIRNNFNRLASALVEEGKMDSAVTVIEKGFEMVPVSVVPYEFFSLEMITTLYSAGARDKAARHTEEALRTFSANLSYLMSLPVSFQLTGDVNEEIQRNLFYIQRMERTSRAMNDNVTADKLVASLNEYISRYPGQK